MDTIKWTLTLPQSLADDARAFGILKDEAVAQLIRAEIERRDAELEAQWEESLLLKSFASAINEDGTIDFAMLAKDSIDMQLDELSLD